MRIGLKLAFSLILVGFLGISGHAQIIQVEPAFPTVDDTVTVTYDATQGSRGLLGVSPVYAHTGVITNTSNSPTDWKYVIAGWTENIPKAKMTDLGDNKHQLRFHIRSYYGVPANVTVEKLAFGF